jgi:murein DD-endopeptidase MepM/ murein hydrolase activator NlpD
MARREWTVVLVSDDDAAVRQFRLSREAMRIAIAAALFLIAGISSVTTGFLLNAGAGRTDSPLQVRNELLARELGELNTRLDTLQESLEHLSEKDEFYRLLAGLEPLDAGVRMAGIGGPDGDSLEAGALYRVDPGLGQQTFTTSTQLASLLRRARLLATSWREAEDSMTEKRARLAATPTIYPTNGYVSSVFTNSRWHPSLDRPRPHTGIDIVARMGTPVVASGTGRVSSVGYQGEYGLLVEVDHGYGIMTRYAHLSKARVRVGQTVQRGDTVGNVGQSGLATGPHLHYEVLVNGQPANPRRYILDVSVVPE